LRLIRQGPGGRRVAGLTIALVIALGAVAACSGDDGDISSTDAADALSRQLLLGPEPRACFVEQFDANETARQPLDLESTPSTDELAALDTVVLACLSPELIAEIVSQAMTSAFGAADPSLAVCVRDEVLALPREDHAVFATGPLAQATFAGSPDQELPAQAQRVGELTRELASTCGLLAPGPPGGGTTSTGVPADETTVSTTAG
jgi:hypothetical protein